ncbi:MAG: hypothetical protein JW910_11305 [Anaerolineae bacterium]|nr:hypothetical protein [Anaerolineae bacterium]
MSNRPIVPDTLAAAKHPPEYRLHKYWARKPANVVAAFLRGLVPAGRRVLDPFCGSGVVLAEARALGLPATGIDLNPAAALLADMTANPPHPSAFFPALESFLARCQQRLAPLYRLPDGTASRYCVHAGIVICPGCGARVSAWTIRAQGRTRRCPACGAQLRFNLATLDGTDVVEVVTAEGVRLRDAAILAQQQAAAYAPYDASPGASWHAVPFLPNGRILAWDGLQVADLFTPRNGQAALLLREDIMRIAPPDQQTPLLTLLTATLAGMSRLIAYRDGLRGGGPAWSVPGFWVAPVHIEHNPLPLLKSRAGRFRRGIERLAARLEEGPPARVIRASAQDALADLARHGERFDLIFLDPAYGDNVPYLEFSALWNAFLGRAPEYAQEVVVSNRTVEAADWAAYEARLGEAVARCVDVLAPEGSVLVTFNNLDGRAWAALLRALHGENLRCESVHYVAPAVISAKAQFSPDGSYQGDFWCVFRRGALPDVPESRWASIWQAAIPAGLADPQRRRRMALRAILEANLPAEAVLKISNSGDF